MLNIFINEEYGFRHWWWEYPYDVEHLILDWNTGHAPFMRKSFLGTLTELPTEFNPDNPFTAVVAGREGNYTLCKNGEVSEKECVSMDDFFDAYIEIAIDDPYLRVGTEYYPMSGDLLPDEEDVTQTFNWADWTEDPTHYYQWFDKWKKQYSCNDPVRATKIKNMYFGELSPQEATQLMSHVEVCQSCQQVYRQLSQH